MANMTQNEKDIFLKYFSESIGQNIKAGVYRGLDIFIENCESEFHNKTIMESVGGPDNVINYIMEDVSAGR